LKKSGLEGQKRRSFSSKGSTKSDNRVLPLKSSSDMMDRGKSFRQKKSDKRNEHKENGIGKFQRKSNLAESEMSDLEADKWIRMLNSKSQSHIYRLNPVQGGEKQNENSKPW
jgi:hypothetical protein